MIFKMEPLDTCIAALDARDKDVEARGLDCTSHLSLA